MQKGISGFGRFLHVLLPLLLVAAPVAFTQAVAQSYPTKPVRVVIPWPAGGSNDVVGRLVLHKVAEATGQRFVIDNRPGAAGTIGSDVVAKAPPDGYTIMVHSTTHLGNAHLYKKLPYDTLKDFTGVALLSAQPGVLTVHPSLPVKTVKEFLALAKSRPKEIFYSSSGNGSAPHLQMALLISMTGIDITHVPYKGGTPQVAALVAGETQASFATIATVIGHIRANRLRPLGVGSAKPSPVLPGIPAISEAGVPGYEMAPWIGIYAPSGTPRDVLERLNTEINKVLAMPDIMKTLQNQALDPSPDTIDAFNARIRTDYEKYGKLIELAGARLE
jgi:tripartite-type tricarboxylate transporter receptor subunit TctC